MRSVPLCKRSCSNSRAGGEGLFDSARSKGLRSPEEDESRFESFQFEVSSLKVVHCLRMTVDLTERLPCLSLSLETQ